MAMAKIWRNRIEGGTKTFEECPDRYKDDVLQLIDEGHSPVMIHDRNDRRFLMFAWEDFFNRFGWLYTKEEKAAIEAACREYEENTNDLLYK